MGQWQLVDLYVDLAKDEIDRDCLAQIISDHVRELSDEERAALESKG